MRLARWKSPPRPCSLPRCRRGVGEEMKMRKSGRRRNPARELLEDFPHWRKMHPGRPDESRAVQIGFERAIVLEVEFAHRLGNHVRRLAERVAELTRQFVAIKEFGI